MAKKEQNSCPTIMATRGKIPLHRKEEAGWPPDYESLYRKLGIRPRGGNFSLGTIEPSRRRYQGTDRRRWKRYPGEYDYSRGDTSADNYDPW